MRTGKVNVSGEYKPFFGCTTLSMLNDPDKELQKIENFLSSSNISKYYVPLPHASYHMTLYNIHAALNGLIPPVKRWMDENGKTTLDNSFLPEEVLKTQHTLAESAIQQHLGDRDITIKSVTLRRTSVLKLAVELQSSDDDSVQALRTDLSKIYEHPDERLKYHITLAYSYRDLPSGGKDLEEFDADMINLMEMVEDFKNYTLNKHGVYLFDSMTNYFLYKVV